MREFTGNVADGAEGLVGAVQVQATEQDHESNEHKVDMRQAARDLPRIDRQRPKAQR